MSEKEGSTNETDIRRQIAQAATRALLAHPNNHIIRVILFGSVARGEVTPQSDIDMCVVFDDQLTNRELLLLGGNLQEYLREKCFKLGVHLPSGLDLTFVNNSHFQNTKILPPQIKATLEEAKEEGVILYDHLKREKQDEHS